MAYKFQLGTARLSGSVIQEGNVTAESGIVSGSEISGSGIALADVSGIAGAALVNNGGVLDVSGLSDSEVGASAGIQFSKMETITAADIIVGNGSGVPTAVGMSGDIGITSLGATTIQAGRVSGSMLNTSVVGNTGGLQFSSNELGISLSGSQLTTSSAGLGVSPTLAALSGLSNSDGNFVVGNGSTFVVESGATARTSLGLGDAAVKSVGISSGNVFEASGAISNSDFLKVNGSLVEGRSAAEVLSDIGAQASSTHLTAIAGLSKTDGNIIVANGTTFVAESGATARTSLGLGTSNDVTFVSGTFTGDMTISGDLTILGGVVSASVSDLLVEDRKIRIGDGLASIGAASTAGAGFEIGNNLASFTMLSSSFLGHIFKSSLEISSSGFHTNDWNIDAIAISGNLPVTASGFNGDLTGNADTATALATARTIGGVSFDGTADINLPGVNQAGNQNTSGNAATATALATARAIGGVNFDGTADIDPTDLNLADAASANSNHNILIAAGATGAQTILTDGQLTFNPSTNLLAAGGFSGDGSNLTGITADVANGVTIRTSYAVTSSAAQSLGGLAGVYSTAVNSASSNMNLHLSGAWSDGDQVYIKAPGQLNGFNVTISRSGSSDLIDGETSVVLESDNAAISLIYSSAGNAWMIF